MTRDSVLLIKNAKLINGTGAVPSENDILIDDGRFKEIGQNIHHAQARVIDATGKTVLPGLVDAHVHLEVVPGSFYRNDQADSLWESRKHHLRAYLACGVTSVLDTGISDGLLRKLRHYMAGGGIGPQIYALGPLLHPPGGYGDAVKVPQWGPLPSAGNEVEIGRQFEAFCGIDDVVGAKMTLESGMGPVRNWPIHSKKLRAFIVKEAEKRSLPIYIHAMRAREQQIGLTMGVHCFAHTGYLRESIKQSFVDEVNRRKIFMHSMLAGTIDGLMGQFDPKRWDDPLIQLTVPSKQLETARDPEAWRKTMFIMMRISFPKWIPDGLVRFLIKKADLKTEFEKQFNSCTDAICKLHKAGVPIVAGTDSGCWPLFLNSFHGTSTIREMELLVKVGIPPIDVIASATRIPAQMMGKLDEFGTIEKGKRADLIMLEGDPLTDISALRKLSLAIKGGDARSPAEWMAA